MRNIYMLKAIFASLFIVTFLFSCYDDKGNYDYREIDEIKVSFPGNTGTDDNIKFVQKLGEQLSIHPEVTCENKENLVYKWERYTYQTDTEILKNANDLDLTLEYGEEAALAWKVGSYSLRYTVQDTITGQTTQKLVHLTVRSITPVGLYVLHGDANETDMGTIEDDNFVDGLTDAIVTPDYYSSQNEGEKLSGEGRGCNWFYGNGNPGMMVFTNHDGKYITTTTFKNEMSFAELFQGDVPTGDIRKLAVSDGIVCLHAENNLYYMDVMYGIDMESPDAFTPVFSSDNQFQQWVPVSGYFFSDSGFMGSNLNYGILAYSESRSSFILYDWYNAPTPSYPWPLRPCADDPNNPAFDPSAETNGMTLIGMDYGVATYSGGSQHQWAMFRNDKDGSIMTYHFNDEAYDDDKATYDMASTIATTKLHTELLDMNCFQMSPLTEGIGFFSTPSGVYSLDMINGMNDAVNELFTAEGIEKITKIKMLKFNDSTVPEVANTIFDEMKGVCLYVTTWDGMQGRIYRLFVDAEGGLDSSREVAKYEGFKEIKDLCFRLQ